MNERIIMFQRTAFLERVRYAQDVNPVCGILGPRQCGKTTLALEYAKSLGIPYHHFDLENSRHRETLMSNPMLSLEMLDGLIILDEIQRCPEVFPVLRYLVDHHGKRLLVLGSASQDLIHQSSETLAGRISYLELTPFTLSEVHDLEKHWHRGGFPKAYLSSSFGKAQHWLEFYIKTFLDRDMASMGIDINPANMRRLWMMIAHYHGQIINYAEVGSSLNISQPTLRRYVDLLEGTFMIRLLKPWHENLSKRQVKSPKIYVRDSGICQQLLTITEKNILGHPKLGALWEGYALEETIRSLGVPQDVCYFWRTSKGAEIDLVVMYRGERLGFEFKYADVPSLTKSMHIGLQDLKLDHLYVITPKGLTYPMEKNVTAIPLEGLVTKKIFEDGWHEGV